MKKMFAVTLCIVLLLVSVPYVFAEQALPESRHEYENNVYETYRYALPGVRALLITFSEDTYVEPSSYPEVITVGDSAGENITVGNIINILDIYKSGDRIYLYDGNGNYMAAYKGDELAGKTVFVPGDNVKIVLSTDSSVTAYGFKVTKAEACPDNLISEVTYHIDGDAETELYYLAEENFLYGMNDLPYYLPDKASAAFAGWSREKNGEIDFDAEEALIAGVGDLNLYPVWVKTLLGTEEIFSFNNSYAYFDETGDGGYYLTDEGMAMLEKNIFSVYGLGPVPAAVLGTVLYTYPNWDWQGSCYGISAVTFLQHYGVIDVLSLQNAASLSEMEMTDELKSYINYYQANAATSWLCENKAAIPGTLNYAQCLKDLYSTVEAGNIAILTFYEGEAFITPGHTVLVVGAYTDKKGGHELIIYDNNRPWHYTGGMTDRFVISPDWTQVTDCYGDDTGAVNWTDSYAQFESFDINGEGSVLTWHQTYFRHIIEVFNRLITMLKSLFQ